MAQLVVTYLPGESALDVRYHYDKAVLELALLKTLDTHGKYQLIVSKRMNIRRALEVIETNRVVNFFVKHPVSDTILDKFGFVAFPVDLGVSSYRTFFVSPKNFSRLNNLKQLKQLKDLSIVTQAGSQEGRILSAHGFKVKQASNYEGLFKMVAKNRVDLFPRGIHEILAEYNFRISNPYLIPDNSVVLHIDLPRFFVTHRSNTKAIERIQTGIEMAYADGSLLALFKAHFLKSVALVAADNTFLFTLDNPFIKNIDKSYQHFLYDFKFNQ